ncbi:larval cuticle protein LCP-14-like [Ostrinia nubilalis]|uniref:larval cuticle protein LCP-14-like n=1 Tax=Ostrinia nubilalis TaxID=29057 RepID=UPI0030824391
MKFLVLAFCVCAASAASYSRPGFSNVAKASASVFVQPAEVTINAAPAPAFKTKPETYVAKTYVNDGKDASADTVRSEVQVNPDSYAYTYETSNGISAEAQGVVKELEKGVQTLVVRGQFQYQSPEGPVSVTYVADENGYQPQSDLIPTAPPVPAGILRALEYIKTHHYEEKKFDKKF